MLTKAIELSNYYLKRTLEGHFQVFLGVQLVEVGSSEFKGAM